MNITGQGQYSKQIAALRDPTKIENMQHKLIFIYPMLFADKIKVPNSQSFEASMRDFLSVTFLSDIFIQNTFNTIQLANQIRPLWDENRQAIDPTLAIARATSNQQYGVYTTPTSSQYPIGPEHQGTIQQKINQKTAVIQHLLKTDPKLAKTRPFIETITLGNMIDVPVIVGTAQYPVDTLTLMYVLIAAIGLNKKLTSEADLEVIFDELEKLDERKYWNLLTNITRTSKNPEDLADWFRGKISSGLTTLSSWKKTPAIVSKTSRNWAVGLNKRKENPPELGKQNHQLAPLLLNKTDLDQTKLYFKFVLNPDFARTRYGIDASKGEDKLQDLSAVKFKTEFTHIKKITLANFSEYVGSVGTSLLHSVTNLISTGMSATADISKLKAEIIDTNMFEKIEPHLDQILSGIDMGLKKSSIESSRNKINILKELCKIPSAEHISDFSKKGIETSVVFGDFDLDKFKQFTKFFEQFATVSASLSTKMENEIKYLSNENEQHIIMSHFDNLKNEIGDSIKEFFKYYRDDLNTSQEESHLQHVTGQDATVINERGITSFETGLIKIFYFILLAQLQASLCKFILTADVDLEMVTNEVTAWPNYTLVLPLEIVTALHAAVMGISWEHMLLGGKPGQSLTREDSPLDKGAINSRGIIQINEGYIKGIIKFISRRLVIPNLIVVDAKRGEIYYKLMNQTDINKQKLSTIDTFVQSKLNRQMTSQF